MYWDGPSQDALSVMIATDQRVTVTPKWVISKILLIFDPVGLYM
jgi:hypothetical protein